MVERRSLTEGTGSNLVSFHTRCEVVAQKKMFLRSCRHDMYRILRRMPVELHRLHTTVPGSSPGGSNNIWGRSSIGRAASFINTSRRKIFKISN